MTAGWSVTVSGLNFGASLGTTPTSGLGRSECGTTSWASATSVACFLSRGDGAEHASTMTVESVAGTGASTFSYDGSSVCPDRCRAFETFLAHLQCCPCVPLWFLSLACLGLPERLGCRSARGQLCPRGKLGRDVWLQRDSVWHELCRQHHHADIDHWPQQLRHHGVGVDVVCGVHAWHGRGHQPRAARDRRWRCGQQQRVVQLRRCARRSESPSRASCVSDASPLFSV